MVRTLFRPALFVTLTKNGVSEPLLKMLCVLINLKPKRRRQFSWRRQKWQSKYFHTAAHLVVMSISVQNKCFEFEFEKR